MARTIKYRTFLSAACATAALTLGGPLAVIGLNAANADAQPVYPVSAQAAQTVAARPQVVSAAASGASAQSSSVDDLLAGLPDASTLTAANGPQSQSAQKVIVAQLEAFRSGNFEQADTYQARSLRASFPSTQQFRIAMSEAYPEFTAYKSVQFGMTTTDATGRYVMVPVSLTGQDDVTVQALYIMLRQPASTSSTGVSGSPAVVAQPSYQVLTVLGGMNPHPLVQAGMDYQTT